MVFGIDGLISTYLPKILLIIFWQKKGAKANHSIDSAPAFDDLVF
jgi:hypothetical protein